MQDDSLLVNYDKLNSDGDLLIKKSQVIIENIESINKLVSQKWDSWKGSDSEAYVNGLKDLIKKINSYAQEVEKEGTYMQTMASKYSKAITNCAKELDANE